MESSESLSNFNRVGSRDPSDNDNELPSEEFSVPIKIDFVELFTFIFERKQHNPLRTKSISF